MAWGVLEWIVGSIALYAAATNVAWALARAATVEHPAPAAPASAVLAAARAAYLFGIPVLAVALRVPGLHAGNLGVPMAGSDVAAAPTGGLPTGDLGIAIVWAVGAVVVVAGGRRWLWGGEAGRLPRGRGETWVARIGAVWLAALLLEVHWAFFRAGALSIGLDNRTLGVFLGLGLLGIEAWVDPANRAAIHDGAALARRARTAILAVLSAIVFLATGSSLACLGGHLLAGTALAVIDPAPPAAPAPAVPTHPTAGADRDGPDIGAIEPTVV